MPEYMTRGTEMMLLQGGQFRYDKGATATTMPLPCRGAGDTPIVVNPELFAGLMKMGVLSIEKRANAVSVVTTTGLQARIPVMLDPFRKLELTVGKDSSAVDPDLFMAWLRLAAIASRTLKSHSIYTYRSNVFTYNRVALVASRLPSAWPVPAVSSAKHVNAIQTALCEKAVVSAYCSRNEILVRTDTMAMQVESTDETMPQPPIDLLSKFKPHSASTLASVDAQTFRSASEQMALVAQALTSRKAELQVDEQMVDFCPEKGGLTVSSSGASIFMEGVRWVGSPIRTPLRAFAALSTIGRDVQTMDLIAAPAAGRSSPLVLRAAETSFFLAAEAGAES